MSSSHEDWDAARIRRDAAAVRVTRTIRTGADPRQEDLDTFALNDHAMERIERELNPYAQQ